MGRQGPGIPHAGICGPHLFQWLPLPFGGHPGTVNPHRGQHSRPPRSVRPACGLRRTGDSGSRIRPGWGNACHLRRIRTRNLQGQGRYRCGMDNPGRPGDRLHQPHRDSRPGNPVPGAHPGGMPHARHADPTKEPPLQQPAARGAFRHARGRALRAVAAVRAWGGVLRTVRPCTPCWQSR